MISAFTLPTLSLLTAAQGTNRIASTLCLQDLSYLGSQQNTCLHWKQALPSELLSLIVHETGLDVIRMVVTSNAACHENGCPA